MGSQARIGGESRVWQPQPTAPRLTNFLQIAQVKAQYSRVLGQTLQAEEKVRQGGFELSLADFEVERYEKMLEMLDEEMNRWDSM